MGSRSEDAIALTAVDESLACGNQQDGIYTGWLLISEICTSVTAMGISCIHTIKDFFDSGSP